MKICDVVLDSVWFDPRVRKQLIQYHQNGDDVLAVGLMDEKYNAGKIKDLPCDVVIADYKRDRLLTIPLVRPLVRKIRIFRCVIKAIRASRAELVHANDLTALIPAYYAATKMKAFLVYDSHEINTESYYQKRKYVYSWVMKCIERYLVKRVDLMVSVSHAAADYFAETYQINKPLVVTNCALKADMTCAQKEKVAGFEVLNQGRFINGRGYDTTVRACSYLMDYPGISLAVRGFGEQEDFLREEREKLLNKTQFVIYDPVDTKDLVSYASMSHVGIAITEPVCLNFKLSVSNKIFEYAAAGLPVIMSDIPEHRYLNNKYNFGIVLEEDTPKCLAEAVIRLFTDKELYEKLKANAVAMSRELNWETEFDKLIQAEKELIKVNAHD